MRSEFHHAIEYQMKMKISEFFHISQLNLRAPYLYYLISHTTDLLYIAKIMSVASYRNISYRILLEQWIFSKYHREEFIHPERQSYISGYMEGFLMKRGKEDSKYLPRKFVLREADDTLKYYIKEVGSTKKNIHPIT